jgi:CRISPR-associated protein Cmr2
MNVTSGQHWQEQLDSQLAGFPEAQWAIAEWPTGSDSDGLPDADRLRQALAGYGTDSLFGEEVWKVLNREVRIDGAEFFKPNAGIIYPAVHELAERSLAAAKSLRPFAPLPQHGHRCTLCGEREWLTETAAQLHIPAGERRETPWLRKAQAGRFGIRKGEHLCGVCTLKRLWPTLFVEGLGELLDDKPTRFVISTHTMALATSLDCLAKDFGQTKLEKLRALACKFSIVEHQPVALPSSLHASLCALRQPNLVEIVKRLPSALDEARGEDAEERLAAGIAETARRQTRDLLRAAADGRRPHGRLACRQRRRLPVPLPGDLAPAGPRIARSFPRRPGGRRLPGLVAARVAGPARRHLRGAQRLLDARRPPHRRERLQGQAALRRWRRCPGHALGRRPAAGDAPAACGLERQRRPAAACPSDIDVRGLQLAKGYARLKGRLMPMMGSRASASIGAVVAHHQAPLSAVLRELRRAEGLQPRRMAATPSACAIIKRGGGEVGVTSRFWEMPHAVGAQRPRRRCWPTRRWACCCASPKRWRSPRCRDALCTTPSNGCPACRNAAAT